MSDYRFFINDHDGNGVPTIVRGKMYRIPSDWTTDSWTHYWDGVEIPAFIDGDWRDGVTPLAGTDAEEDTARAITAFKAERDSETGSAGGLVKVAQRITGNPEARFVCVGLDRGVDFYALSWNGDPDNEWRDEIEALNYGEVYRIECEEFAPGCGVGDSDWVTSDEYPEAFYGEAKAEREFARAFPLTEFPADLFTTAND